MDEPEPGFVRHLARHPKTTQASHAARVSRKSTWLRSSFFEVVFSWSARRSQQDEVVAIYPLSPRAEAWPRLLDPEFGEEPAGRDSATPVVSTSRRYSLGGLTAPHSLIDGSTDEPPFSPRGRRCPGGADEGARHRNPFATSPSPAFGHLLPRGEKGVFERPSRIKRRAVSPGKRGGATHSRTSGLRSGTPLCPQPPSPSCQGTWSSINPHGPRRVGRDFRFLDFLPDTTRGRGASAGGRPLSGGASWLKIGRVGRDDPAGPGAGPTTYR